MSDSPPLPADDTALTNVLLAFANLFPEPTDDQTHALAGLLGYSKSEFTTLAQQLLAPILSDDEDAIGDEPEDAEPLDTFLLSFYLFNSEPTEDHLQVLSILLGLTLEELESKTYSVIQKLTEIQPHDGVSNLNSLDDNFIADDDEEEVDQNSDLNPDDDSDVTLQLF